MAGLMQVPRTNLRAAIAAALLLTADLVAAGEAQLASLLGCTAGVLLMWKSEIDTPAAPPAPDAA
jgi:hypothetical protein